MIEQRYDLAQIDEAMHRLDSGMRARRLRSSSLEPDNRRMSERRTSPVELLWDLVFVFAVTQVTTLIAHDLTWTGFGHGLLLLALVWWAWSAFVWAANAEEEDARTLRASCCWDAARLRRRSRAAVGVRREATLFAVRYAAVRLLHLGMYAHAARAGNASWSAIVVRGHGRVGMALLVAGSFLAHAARGHPLDGRVLIDYAGPGVADA